MKIAMQADGSQERSEVEVLKALIVREEYIKQLRKVVGNPRSNAKRERYYNLSALIRLFDLLRSATINVVEEIQLWRKPQEVRQAFQWKGTDYLTKITTDTDFLDDHEV